MKARGYILGCGLGFVCLAACALESGEDELGTFRVQSGDGTLVTADPNRPGSGGTWLGNGLEDPDISGLDPANGLGTGQGLLENGGLLSTADGLDIARYVVECALPLGQSISKNVGGQPLVLEGLLGLAPEWKTGDCDEDCQQWVSACLLARTNISGQAVSLWVAADHPAVGLGTSPAYPLHEAAFFGNLFASTPALYFCRGSDDAQVAAVANGRTCTGDDPALCGFTAYKSCVQHERCDFVGGFATDCAAGNNANGDVYHSISTFVSLPEG
jgi:hypothetical protein